jgi:hypothetical protein
MHHKSLFILPFRMKSFSLQILFFLTLILLTGISFELITARQIVLNSDFQLKNNPKYVVFGHSHPEQAFNDSLINNFSNLAEAGESFFYTFHKTKEIIKNNPSIETVFIEFTNNSIDHKMDNWTWDSKYMSYRLERFGSLISFQDKLKLFYHNPKCFTKTLPFIIKERGQQFIDNNLIFSKKIGGFKIAKPSNREKIIDKNVRFKNLSINTKKEFSFSKVNILYLQKLIEHCRSNGKQVILIRTPQRKDYVFWDNELLFQRLRKQYFGDVKFIDFSKIIFKNTEYLDAAHLNKEGAKKLSIFFNKILKSNLLEQSNFEEIYNLMLENNIHE